MNASEGTTEIHASVFEHMNFDGDYEVIPQHMRDAIMRYATKRLEPGSFLEGILTNDLRKAVFNADAENLPLIKTYMLWFYNRCPAFLVGPENYRQHLAGGSGAAE
jgi:hypothetical protein